MEKCYILSKKDVEEALVNHIAIFIEGQKFYPFEVDKLDIDLPKTVTVTLKYIPKGTKREE